MLDKFNLYDFLGYLIPGGMVTLVLYWLAFNAFALPLPALKADLGTSIFFVGLSYLVGHVVQAIGSRYEDRLNKKDCGRLSERLLSPDDMNVPEKDRFSPRFKKHVIDCAKVVFQVGDEPLDRRGARTWRQELFDYCYALIVQQDCAQHNEIFLALNGLARGTYIASGIGLLAGLSVVVMQIALWARTTPGAPLPASKTWQYNAQLLTYGWILVAIFLMSGLLARRMFREFRTYFATSVYYNFVAWCGRQSLHPGAIRAPRRLRLASLWRPSFVGIGGFVLGRLTSRRLR